MNCFLSPKADGYHKCRVSLGEAAVNDFSLLRRRDRPAQKEEGVGGRRELRLTNKKELTSLLWSPSIMIFILKT